MEHGARRKRKGKDGVEGMQGWKRKRVREEEDMDSVSLSSSDVNKPFTINRNMSIPLRHTNKAQNSSVRTRADEKLVFYLLYCSTHGRLKSFSQERSKAKQN